MTFRKDCIHFNGMTPCSFHKHDARTCDQCSDLIVRKHIIGIIKLDAVGDVLRTTAILKPLSEKYPDAHIIWITRKESAPIFQNNQYVHDVVTYDEYIRVLPVKFDVLINFDNTRLSAALLALLHAQEKKGFVLSSENIVEPTDGKANMWYELGLNDTKKKENKKTYQQIISEIADINIPYSDIVLNLSHNEKIYKHDFIKKHHLKEKKIIGIVPGSSLRWPSKRWPIGHFKTLISKINTHDISLIIYGTDTEKDIIDELTSEFPFLLTPNTQHDLRKFFTLIDIPDIIITGDTLALHAAAAFHKTIIALVGPTSAYELDIYENGTIITGNSKCLCCYNKICDQPVSCMESLPVEKVYDQIKKFL
jgi:ADP-heptose:LPS heptosyltransferase